MLSLYETPSLLATALSQNRVSEGLAQRSVDLVRNLADEFDWEFRIWNQFIRAMAFRRVETIQYVD
ncbi:hypothetical protein HI914_06244 [Erysiphe necator]|nr:hypothetical protein HI914_06244 [Erysiphe necator]